MTREREKNHILVTAAVPLEAAGIRDRMADFEAYRNGGRPVFEGRIGKTRVRLLITGPGMVNTAQGMTAAIECDRPSMILMTGCAGGFERAGLNIGDIGVAEGENDAHLGIEPEEQGMPPYPLPFDLEEIDGKAIGARIPLDTDLSRETAAILKEGFKNTPVNIVCGPFVTVSTITATDRGAAGLFNRFHACMESMEGVAGAHVATHYGIPFIEMRCASNLVGKRDREGWDLSLACGRSTEAAVMWIDRYGEK